jgi:hypothetical protein
VFNWKTKETNSLQFGLFIFKVTEPNSIPELIPCAKRAAYPPSVPGTQRYPAHCFAFSESELKAESLLFIDCEFPAVTKKICLSRAMGANESALSTACDCTRCETASCAENN